MARKGSTQFLINKRAFTENSFLDFRDNENKHTYGTFGLNEYFHHIKMLCKHNLRARKKDWPIWTCEPSFSLLIYGEKGTFS